MFKQKAKTSFNLPPVLRVLGWLKLVFFLVALGGGFLYTRAGVPTRVEAATSSTLNFQARLYNASGTIVPDGTYNIEFKLHDNVSSSGGGQGTCSGSCEWRETRTGGNQVTVKNGYFSVNLGSVTGFPAINWDQDLWLSMNIGGTGAPSWDGEMTPRIKLTAVPYAFRAGGLTSYNGTQSGNLTFGTVANSPNIILPDIAGTNGVLLQNGTTLMTQGSITFVDSAGRLTQDNANFFWNDSQNRLGIGTNSPSEALEVAGTVRSDALFVDTAGSAATPSIRLGTGLGIFSPGANTFAIATNSVERLQIEADGDVTVDTGTLFVDATNNRVGIGDTTPAYPFTVGNGDIFGVQSDGSLIFEGSSADGFETVLTVQNATADLTFELPDAAAGTYEICTSANNCTALGAYINNTTTIQADANIAISSAGTGDITVALRERSGQTADLLQFQNTSGTALSGIDDDGNLYYRDPTGGETVTIALQSGSVSANRTLTLPNADGEICTTAGNCIGNGGSGDVFKNGQSGPLIIGTNDNTSFYLESNNTNRIEITGSGLVGIGTSSTPSALLSVGGTTGNFTVDSSGNVTTAGNLTVNGSTIQLGNNPADALNVFAAATFNTNVDFTLADSENVAITSTQTNSSNLNLFDLSFTNDSTGGTQTLARIQNAGGTADTEQLLLLDNADTDNAVTTGLLIQSAAGGITTGIDLSDTEIGTGINLGANDIIGTTAVINFDNFDVSSTGDVTLLGDLDAGLLVVDNTAGTATATGGFIFSGVAGNDITTGTDEDLTLQANGNGQIILDDLVQIGALGTGGDTALCLNTNGEISTCDGGVFGVTLQDAYDASSTPEIVLDSTRGALTLRDNATPLGTNLLEVQSNDGTNTYFAVTATGLLTSGDISLTGATGTIATTTTDAPLTIQSNGAGALTLDSTGTGAINIGTSANAKTITVGNGSGATQLVLDAGTGGINIGTNGVANTIQIGNTTGAVTQNINIGNNLTGGSTSNVTIGSAVAGTVALQGPTTITNRTTGAADTLVVNNSTSTGTIALFQDNGVAVLTIADGGNITGTGSYTFSGVATDITTGTDEDLTLVANGNGEIVLNDLVQIGVLGSADNDAVLCQNSSGQVASCSSTFATTDNAFLQNGNDFGVGIDGTLGLTSANDLHIITDNITRLTVEADGDVAFNTDTLFVDAQDGQVGIGTATPGATLDVVTGGATEDALRVNNGTSTGAIFVAQDNGATVFSIADGGVVTSTAGIVFDGAVTDISTANAGDLTLTADGAGVIVLQDSVTVSGTQTFSGVATDITTGTDEDLTVVANGNGIIDLNDIVRVGTLASADTDSAYVCRDGSTGQLSACPTTGNGAAFVQGGNDFGNVTGNLGLTSNNDLNIITNNATRFTVQADGDIAFDTDTLFVDAANDRVGIGTTTPGAALEVITDDATEDAFIVNNGTSTGDIFVGQDNGVTVFSIADGGVVTSTGGIVFDGAVTDITTGTDQDLTLQANGVGEIILDDIVQVSTLGATDTADYVCLNSSGQIAGCNTTGDGAAFVQGGNSFGDTAILGTNDAEDLQFETAGVTRFTLNQTGDGTLTGNLTVQGTGTSSFAGALEIDGNTTLGDGAGDSVTINGSTVTAPNTLDFNTGQLYLHNVDDQVGIGTTVTGTSRLTVQAAGGGSQTALTVNNATSTGDIFVAQDNGVTVFSIADGGAITATNGITFDGAVTDITTGTDQDLTLQANGIGEIILDDIVQVSTLGAADNAVYLCLNSNDQLAACNTTGDGAAFVQGGNSFGDTAILGTNDAEDLQLETAGVTRLTINQSGDATLTGNLTVQGTGTSSIGGALEIDGNTTLGDANTDTITINGTAVTIPNGLNIDSNTLVIDDDNNRVGIGTASPDVSLQVASGTEATLSNNTGNLVLGSVSGANLVMDTDEIQARNNGSAATLFLQPSGGNVAIGSAAADGRLHIQGTADDEQLVITANATQTANIIEVRSSGGTVLAAVTGTGILKIDTVAAPTLSQAKLLVTNAEIVDRLRVGDASDRIETDATTQQLRFFGTARNSLGITLAPEFAGATMTGDGGSNVGTMTSDFCSDGLNINDGGGANACDTGEQHNYYSWTANASNDYSVWTKWRVPSNFDEFETTPMEFYGWSNSANHTVQVTVYEGSTVCGTATVSNSGGWALSSAIDPASGCSVAANDELTIRVQMTIGSGGVLNTDFVRVGEIFINYKAAF